MISRRDALMLGAAGMMAPSLGAVLPAQTMAAQKQSGNVPMFRGNAARTGEMPGPGPSLDKPIIVKSEFLGTVSPPSSTPVVVDDVIFVASGSLNFTTFETHSVDSLDANTGTILWRSTTAANPSTSPAVADGFVFFGSDDGNLYAIQTNDGQELWHFSTGGELKSSPIVIDQIIYFGSKDNNLYAVDTQSGKEHWRFTTADEVNSSPAVKNGVVYVGSDDNNLYAIDTATGQERWRFATGDQIRSSPAVVEEVVYLCSGVVFAIDTASGVELWHSTQAVGDASPAIVDGIVYVVGYDGKLYALDAETGAERWQFATDQGLMSSPVSVDGVIYVNSNENNIHMLDAKSGAKFGHLWALHGSQSEPVIVGGVVYLTSSFSVLYALGNLEELLLISDVTMRGGPSTTAVERGAAEDGDVIDSVGAREEREGQVWAEVTIGDVTGWIPLDAIDPATLPPEGEIEYVYIPE